MPDLIRLRIKRDAPVDNITTDVQVTPVMDGACEFIIQQTIHDNIKRRYKPGKLVLFTLTAEQKAQLGLALLVDSAAETGNYLTLDGLITAAVAAKAASPLSGGTVVHHCEMHREYIPARRAVLDTDAEHPEDGAVFLVCTNAAENQIHTSNCRECGSQMFVGTDGVANHGEPGEIDHDLDADHVAIAEVER